MDKDNKKWLLSDLKERYAECKACPELIECRQKRTLEIPDTGRLVFGHGNPDSRIMLIGEAPGADEDMRGLPFVGRSGEMLNTFLEALNVISSTTKRAMAVYITNAVLCLPPIVGGARRNPSPIEIKNCRNRLMEQIAIIDPIAILLVGSKALYTFFSNSKKISDSRGEFYTIEVPGVFGPIKYPAMAIYHPSYLLRNYSLIIDKPVYQTLMQLKKFFEVIDRYKYLQYGDPLPSRELPDLEQTEETTNA